MINKLLKKIMKKAYQKELNHMLSLLNQKQTQIENLKKRLRYTEKTNIFNFEERKYRNEHL